MRDLRGITPSDEQNRAIRAIVDWYTNSSQQEFLLDGEAGTGKSTTAAFAVAELGSLPKNPARRVLSGAYTAKAAKVMRDKGVKGASTIHKMIYVLEEDTGIQLRWRLDPLGPCADADLIVIDEVSMVNQKIADDLRSYSKKILVLGDVDGQLPPVEGAGAFTSREPDFRLLELNRFALESPIVRLAARARRREFIPFGRVGDVEVTPLDEDSWSRIYRRDTQVICGVHRNRWRATQMIRAEYGFEGELPLRGERLICCRNNYDLGLFNGAFGEAVSSAASTENGSLAMAVRMEDQDVDLEDLQVARHLFAQHFTGDRARAPFEPGTLEFDWGYAITCHKSQGSEWPHVTVIDDSYAFLHSGGPDIARRWLYTAITRASQGLTLLLRRRP